MGLLAHRGLLSVFSESLFRRGVELYLKRGEPQEQKAARLYRSVRVRQIMCPQASHDDEKQIM